MGNYPQEFKDELVALHRQGRTFMELGKEFNVSPTSVANWARAVDRRDAAAGSSVTSGKGSGKDVGSDVESDKAKIARLERELARKSEELEILGKALAFFVRRTDP